jgi:hypothetical protein
MLTKPSFADKWLCNACLIRRTVHGFPEHHTNKLINDRYAQILPKILAWGELAKNETPAPDKDGLTPNERGQMARIEARLREKGSWPEKSDPTLCAYRRWEMTARLWRLGR